MLDQDVEPDGEVLSSLRQQPSQSEPAGLNGPGLWDNWTRSFTSPVMALLDLFDNSMDATMCGDHKNLKKIHMFGDVHPKDANEETGLCIINSCAHRIPPLKEVMRVFKSLKHTQQIGENGVGIKQACAALSDLSFVLTKNKSEFSLGLISRGLQEEDQNINLPTYRFIRENDSFKNFLDNLIASEEELEACVVCYGDNDLELGKDRLIRHFRKLVSYPWAEDDHVFLVVLHNIQHQNKDVQGSRPLMDNFAKNLPRNYLHVPIDFDVRVGGNQVRFQYWERRLVELAKCPSRIDPVNSWALADDWQNPVEGYNVNIYIGFDPRRSLTKDNKACLLIYSRKSGRLIKHVKDARNILNLDSGGTKYAQGLTIIVDDVNGRLPLTPTKQDLAFGNESHGEVHEANLYAWLGAYTHLYYDRFLSICKRKETLRLAVQGFLEEAKALRSREIGFTLSNGDFNSFGELLFRKYQDTKILRSTAKNYNVSTVGPDTLLRFDVNTLQPPEDETPAKRKPRDPPPPARALPGSPNYPVGFQLFPSPTRYPAANQWQSIEFPNPGVAAMQEASHSLPILSDLTSPSGKRQKTGNASSPPSPPASATEQELRAKGEENAALKAEIAELREKEAEMNALKAEIAHLRTKLREKERAVDEKNQALEDINIRFDELNQDLEMEKQLSAVNAKRAKQNEAVREDLKNQLEIERQHSTKLAEHLAATRKAQRVAATRKLLG